MLHREVGDSFFKGRPFSILLVSSGRCGSPGEIRTPVDGFLPISLFSVQSPSLTGSLFRPLLVHYTTGLQARVSCVKPNKPSPLSGPRSTLLPELLT